MRSSIPLSIRRASGRSTSTPRGPGAGSGAPSCRLCERAARSAGFTRLELLATLPGVPLYSAFGYSEIRAVAEPIGEGLTLPGIVMGKAI